MRRKVCGVTELTLEEYLHDFGRAAVGNPPIYFIIGAGVSISAGIPDAKTLIASAVDSGLLSSADFERLREDFRASMMILTPKQRQEFVEQEICSVDTPNFEAILLAGMLKYEKVKCILSHNFDTLIETAAHVVGTKVYARDLPGADDPSPLTERTIIYLHGRYGTRFILTDAEISRRKKSLTKRVEEVVNSGIVIVLGYSGESDLTLDVLTRCKNIRHRIYWVCFQEDRPSEVTRKKLSKISEEVRLVVGPQLDAATFLNELWTRVWRMDMTHVIPDVLWPTKHLLEACRKVQHPLLAKHLAAISEELAAQRAKREYLRFRTNDDISAKLARIELEGDYEGYLELKASGQLLRAVSRERIGQVALSLALCVLPSCQELAVGTTVSEDQLDRYAVLQADVQHYLLESKSTAFARDLGVALDPRLWWKDDKQVTDEIEAKRTLRPSHVLDDIDFQRARYAAAILSARRNLPLRSDLLPSLCVEALDHIGSPIPNEHQWLVAQYFGTRTRRSVPTVYIEEVENAVRYYGASVSPLDIAEEVLLSRTLLSLKHAEGRQAGTSRRFASAFQDMLRYMHAKGQLLHSVRAEEVRDHLTTEFAELPDELAILDGLLAAATMSA